MLLPGVYGYADAESVAAGQTIRFYLSSSSPCRVSICRLGTSVDDPAADEVLHRFAPLAAAQQPLYPGSYVFVESGLRGTYRGFGAEGWVRPWRIDRPQALLAQEGSGVWLNAAGGLDARLGSTALSSPAGLLRKDAWHHWALAADGRELVLWLDGKPAGRTPHAGKIAFLGGPLTFGAAVNRSNQLEHFLDGDLAACALHDRPLTAAQVGQRHAAKGLRPAAPDGLLAAWPFTEEGGATVRDASAHGRHGQLINHGTWMVGGPSFEAEVDRFGGYQPKPTRTADTRCASPPTTSRLRLARNPGVHRGRRRPNPASTWPGVHTGEAEGTDFYDISFVVRKAAGQPRAPVLVLAPPTPGGPTTPRPLPSGPTCSSTASPPRAAGTTRWSRPPTAFTGPTPPGRALTRWDCACPGRPPARTCSTAPTTATCSGANGTPTCGSNGKALTTT
jgi:hypothetical protein